MAKPKMYKDLLRIVSVFWIGLCSHQVIAEEICVTLLLDRSHTPSKRKCVNLYGNIPQYPCNGQRTRAGRTNGGETRRRRQSKVVQVWCQKLERWNWKQAYQRNISLPATDLPESAKCSYSRRLTEENQKDPQAGRKQEKKAARKEEKRNKKAEKSAKKAGKADEVPSASRHSKRNPAHRPNFLRLIDQIVANFKYVPRSLYGTPSGEEEKAKLAKLREAEEREVAEAEVPDAEAESGKRKLDELEQRKKALEEENAKKQREIEEEEKRIRAVEEENWFEKKAVELVEGFVQNSAGDMAMAIERAIEHGMLVKSVGRAALAWRTVKVPLPLLLRQILALESAGIDAELHAAVIAVYASVLQFDGAFETMDEVFTSIVESSPAIALEKLKKAIKARRALKAGREEREKESREKWGLELSVGQVTNDLKFSHDTMLIESIRSWQSDLESGAKPVRQAPMYTVAILLACELVVRKSSIAVGYRLMSFILLLMVWCTLRADDVQNIDPSSLQLSQVGLRFVLGRTKTSGPGRRVGTLPGFISRTTGISGLDWMAEGMRLLKNADFGWSRDFLCPRFNSSWDDCERDYMDAEGLALQFRRFLSELRTPFRHEGRWGLSRELLISGRMVHFWTGHSGRHTFPSLAAALEVGKEKRDFLGRWAYSQHGSQDYVLTARQVVHGVQNHVCRVLLTRSASGGYVEEETLNELESFARANGLDSGFLNGHRVLRWDANQRTWALGGTFPAFQLAI
ncbi:unnamed protein product [Symbiodinium sp. KB8]|nr:unnamed protein product [Symbiodinium sp. KB8]